MEWRDKNMAISLAHGFELEPYLNLGGSAERFEGLVTETAPAERINSTAWLVSAYDPGSKRHFLLEGVHEDHGGHHNIAATEHLMNMLSREETSSPACLGSLKKDSFHYAIIDISGIRLTSLVEMGTPKFKEEEISCIVSDILYSLAALHRLQLMHRHVKCDYVYVDKSGKSFLLGYTDAALQLSSISRDPINASKFDHAIDVELLGVMLLHMVLGYQPQPPHSNTLLSLFKSSSLNQHSAAKLDFIQLCLTFPNAPQVEELQQHAFVSMRLPQLDLQRFHLYFDRGPQSSDVDEYQGNLRSDQTHMLPNCMAIQQVNQRTSSKESQRSDAGAKILFRPGSAIKESYQQAEDVLRNIHALWPGLLSQEEQETVQLESRKQAREDLALILSTGDESRRLDQFTEQKLVSEVVPCYSSDRPASVKAATQDVGTTVTSHTSSKKFTYSSSETLRPERDVSVPCLRASPYNETKTAPQSWERVLKSQPARTNYCPEDPAGKLFSRCTRAISKWERKLEKFKSEMMKEQCNEASPSRPSCLGDSSHSGFHDDVNAAKSNVKLQRAQQESPSITPLRSCSKPPNRGFCHNPPQGPIQKMRHESSIFTPWRKHVFQNQNNRTHEEEGFLRGRDLLVHSLQELRVDTSGLENRISIAEPEPIVNQLECSMDKPHHHSSPPSNQDNEEHHSSSPATTNPNAIPERLVQPFRRARQLEPFRDRLRRCLDVIDFPINPM